MTEETDEQVQRRLEARDVRQSRQWVDLVDVFIEHFPTSTIDPALHEAMSIFNKFHCDKLSEFKWDPNKEIEKLEKLKDAIDEVCNLHASLKRRVREALNNEYVKLDYLISDLQQGAPSVITSASIEAESGKTYGKNNMNYIALIEAIRSVWASIKGKPAPKSWNPATPFGRFASDVFDALDALDAPMEPSSAMKAWRRQVDS